MTCLHYSWRGAVNCATATARLTRVRQRVIRDRYRAPHQSALGTRPGFWMWRVEQQ